MSRTDAAFGRLNDRLFAHFGDEAVLRGTVPVSAVKTEGVELLGEYGQVAQIVTTFTLMASAGGKVGDSLTVGAESWVLDSVLRGDGGTTEFVVRPA